MPLGFSRTTCSAAAEGGYADVIGWLKKQGYPWNHWISIYVVKRPCSTSSYFNHSS